MRTRSYLPAPMIVLLLGTSPSAGDGGRPDGGGPESSAITCRFKPCHKWERLPWRSTFHVRGTAHDPRYVVNFDGYSGGAILERHGLPWAETFRLEVNGDRDTIMFVSLTPEGYGQMSLLSLPGKKWVQYFDARGKWLEGPAAGAFRFEAEETIRGLDVKVTLPAGARSMRRLDVRYFSTCW